MSYRLVYEPGARELVRHLPPPLKPFVKAAIESLRNDPYGGKALKLELSGFRSLRSTQYRIIYRIRVSDRVVEIHYFGVRRNVYELFRRLLEG